MSAIEVVWLIIRDCVVALRIKWASGRQSGNGFDGSSVGQLERLGLDIFGNRFRPVFRIDAEARMDGICRHRVENKREAGHRYFRGRS